MKILLTGFEAFQGESRNPSREIALRLRKPEIDVLILPVSFEKVFEVLRGSLQQSTYDFVLMLGQAGGRKMIGLERIAVNLIDSEAKDEEGYGGFGQKIEPDGPEAYLSPLPLRQWATSLKERSRPVEISNSAGLFVCNYLYYRLTHFIRTENLSTQCLFVHVPYMTEQMIDKDVTMPSLSLDVMKDCVLELLKLISDPRP